MLIIKAKLLGTVCRKKTAGGMVVRCRVEADELGGICEATAFAESFPVHLLVNALRGKEISVSLPDTGPVGLQRLPTLLPWPNQSPDVMGECWLYLQERATADIEEVPWQHSRQKIQVIELEQLLELESGPEAADSDPPLDEEF